jgi:hypothetical protein
MAVNAMFASSTGELFFCIVAAHIFDIVIAAINASQ